MLILILKTLSTINYSDVNKYDFNDILSIIIESLKFGIDIVQLCEDVVIKVQDQNIIR